MKLKTRWFWHKVRFYGGVALVILLTILAIGVTLFSQPITYTREETAFVVARKKLPSRPTPEQVGGMLNEVAGKFPHLRLLRKESGAGCPSPAGRISCDIVIDTRNGHHFDVLADSDGAAMPIPFVDKGFCTPGPDSACDLSNAAEPVLGEGGEEEPPAQPSIQVQLDRIEGLIKAVGPCPTLPITREEFDALSAAVKAERDVTMRVPFFGGTAKGTVGGVK